MRYPYRMSAVIRCTEQRAQAAPDCSKHLRPAVVESCGEEEVEIGDTPELLEEKVRIAYAVVEVVGSIPIIAENEAGAAQRSSSGILPAGCNSTMSSAGAPIWAKKLSLEELKMFRRKVMRFQLPFTGVLCLALVPSPENEEILNRFSSVYPVRGHATSDKPFTLGFEWKTRGGPGGELLMLSLPMHRSLLVSPSLVSCRIPEIRFRSIDGVMEGVLGERWLLEAKPISTGWYSENGISDSYSRDRIKHALESDVSQLDSIATESSYFYGKPR